MRLKQPLRAVNGSSPSLGFGITYILLHFILDLQDNKILLTALTVTYVIILS